MLLSGGLDSSAMTATRRRAQLGEARREGAQLRGRLRRPRGRLRGRRAARHPGHAVRARRGGRASAPTTRHRRSTAATSTDPEVRRDGDHAPATCRSASATWTPRSTCCSRRSASTRRWRCPASPPTRCSAATAGSSTRRPQAATPSRGWRCSQRREWRPARSDRFDPKHCARLDLASYVGDQYADGASPRSSGCRRRERPRVRMREICYLHLTRFVRILLDRKDRMSAWPSAWRSGCRSATTGWSSTSTTRRGR